MTRKNVLAPSPSQSRQLLMRKRMFLQAFSGLVEWMKLGLLQILLK
jgi:hypothetical protein